jgi:hypothetical protein
MSLTALQIAQEIDTLIDKAASPYFNDAKKTVFFNLAYNDVVQTEYERYEQNDERSFRILSLQAPFSKANSNKILIPADVPNFMYPLRIRAKFNGTDCDGKPETFWSNVRKTTLNKIDVARQDPFNKPIDRDPLYCQKNDTGNGQYIEIYSETTPVTIEGDYLKRPTVFVINTVGAPNAVFPQSDEVTHEIIQLAVKKMLGNIENYNGMKAIQQEIPQASGAFSN